MHCERCNSTFDPDPVGVHSLLFLLPVVSAPAYLETLRDGWAGDSEVDACFRDHQVTVGFESCVMPFLLRKLLY